MSRVCKSFDVLPSAAKDELEQHTPLLLDVLEARDDEVLLDMAMEMRKGNEEVTKRAERLPKHLQRILVELVMSAEPTGGK